jgi:gamma-butyrobetaine dioxygenase
VVGPHCGLGLKFTNQCLYTCPGKRYLCAVEKSYFAQLSSVSLWTPAVTGGSMSGAEVATFELERYFADAVRMRRWDDQGKVPFGS